MVRITPNPFCQLPNNEQEKRMKLEIVLIFFTCKQILVVVQGGSVVNYFQSQLENQRDVLH